ncbi:enoyl-CoA hydratase [Bacillus taeanensis]|uniref:Enoyl-CoA hydratase n=1 Tax=Bacillus taeanensis TaxID=273032 RepID=A0A366XZE9_9BACI|nr:enoyl-CoA hydratase [Bacillus taeanensis]RBW71532.1 enoyl-CoA hydratase [Bacillus taeanensis]
MALLAVSKQRASVVITLKSPPANALSSKLIEEISQALDRIKNDKDVKVVVIHGDGRFFSAGADIKEFTSVTDGKAFSKMSSRGQEVFNKIENFPKPVLAAIHGAALGGGLELAMACHMRFVTADAKLGLPELQLGLIPGFGGTQRLASYIGKAKAAELMLTSEPITGQEAVTLGLANASFENEHLLESVLNIAYKIADKSAPSIKTVLELLTYTALDQKWEGMKQESLRFGEMYETYDAKEGIKAFIEKRKPNFQDH